ncbi:hypothetical protein AB0O76_10695 [Streptomyces sp. NPDC086554]|uniref:hypothetical protein n=1 Tax=Streptomyces sp. NPDC086554 TaxID=3154864 RepID=UPI003445F3F3
MRETELAQSLADAGLKYLGMADDSAPLMPPNLASFANSTAAEGRAVGVGLENGLPDLQATANSEWYRLAMNEGLFPADDPEFLLSVSAGDPESPRVLWWARVALEAEWDLAGAGAASRVTGNGWGHPEFVMLSVDGDVVARGSTGEEYTDLVFLRDPHRIQSIRNFGADMAHWPDLPKATRDAVARWLEHTACPGPS